MRQGLAVNTRWFVITGKKILKLAEKRPIHSSEPEKGFRKTFSERGMKYGTCSQH
jgi:hypothetical protein